MGTINGKISYLQILLMCKLYHCIDTSLQKSQTKPGIWKPVDSVEDYPYVVWVIIFSGEHTLGVIINKSWVLSAAHLLEPIPLAEIQIKAGFFYNNLGGLLMSFSKFPIQIEIHPNYKTPGSDGTDLALLKVKDPFVLYKRVNILTLSDVRWTNKTNFEKCEMVDWTYSINKALTLSKLHVLRNHGPGHCKCRSPDFELICVEHKKGEDCPTAVGSGLLLCNGKLIGIRSFTYPASLCANLKSNDSEYHFEYDSIYDIDLDAIRKIRTQYCYKDTVGAHVFIPSKLNWIRKHIKSISTVANARSIYNAQCLKFIMLLVFMLII